MYKARGRRSWSVAEAEPKWRFAEVAEVAGTPLRFVPYYEQAGTPLCFVPYYEQPAPHFFQESLLYGFCPFFEDGYTVLRVNV